jgi:N6-adenosine-specific RNA methylase IME4
MEVIMQNLEFHPVADIFPLMTGSEFETLKQDIDDNGLIEPIWTYNNQIIDGRNRYRACKELNIEPTYREWDQIGSLVQFVVSLNLNRRHLDTSQRALIGAKIKPMFEEEAKRRSGQRTDLSANLRLGDWGKSSEKAADAVNVSSRSIETADVVLERGSKALVKAVQAGEVSVSAASIVSQLPHKEQDTLVARGKKEILTAAKDINAATKEKRREERLQQFIDEDTLPDAKFRIVYADPPWQYSNTIPDYYGPPERHYPTMTLVEICAFPVKDICEDNAVLFLWVTSPILEESFQVIRSWGFKYKTSFVWDKIKHNMGHYNSVRHELLLVCTRGSYTPTMTKLELHDSVISIERSDRHSEKPNYFRELIDKLYPSGKRIELFARTEHQGWDNYGNELQKGHLRTAS